MSYFYIIQDREDKKYYVGSKRSFYDADNGKSLLKTYFTSSESVISKIFKENRIFIIRKIIPFETYAEAHKHEYKFIRRVCAITNEKFLNGKAKKTTTTLCSRVQYRPRSYQCYILDEQAGHWGKARLFTKIDIDNKPYQVNGSVGESLGRFSNFFDACCARKSAESRYYKKIKIMKKKLSEAKTQMTKEELRNLRLNLRKEIEIELKDASFNR